MWEFFNGWKRSVGCGAMVMALASFCFWTRSILIEESVAFSIANRRHVIASMSNELIWWTWEEPVKYEVAGMINWGDVPDPAESFDRLTQRMNIRQAVHTAVFAPNQVSVCRIPYWTIVGSLALLAAILMLWPRRKKSDNTVNSTAENS